MRRTLRTLLAAGFWWLSPTLLHAATPGTKAAPQESSIPYVATRHDTVRDLLWMADVGTNDVVYDLGSGDGRVTETFMERDLVRNPNAAKPLQQQVSQSAPPAGRRDWLPRRVGP